MEAIPVCGRSRRYGESNFWDDFYTNLHGQELEWSAPVCDAILSKIQPVLKGLHGTDKRPLRICELGCGTSSLAAALAANTTDGEVEVIGVDFSQEAIVHCQKRHPELQWHCCDALKLTDEFDLGSFDCVIAKTLLDCFLARNDAAASVLHLCQQVRAVLKDDGVFMLFDRIGSPRVLGAGKLEEVHVPKEIGKKKVFFRFLKATLPDSDSVEANDASGEPSRIELELPPLDGVVTHRPAGCGILVVWTADKAAEEAGLLSGDRLLQFDLKDGKGFQAGKPAEMQKALRKGKRLCVLVERSVATTVSLRSAASEKNKVASRRSVSQSDYLLRQQRARCMRSESSEKNSRRRSDSRSKHLPQLFPNAEDHISAAQDSVAKGLFV